ncbi:MAG: hypothetical protein ACAH09_07615 [Methylophilaceae bacterium]|nr:hypothetical protein [Methylophilaceae bacterium]
MTKSSMQGRAISNHILPTASNMVGVCMMVVSVLQLLPKNSVLPWGDKLLAIDSLIFLASAMFSYRSLRIEGGSESMEKYADWLFLTGLSVMALAGVLVSFELFLV